MQTKKKYFVEGLYYLIFVLYLFYLKNRYSFNVKADNITFISLVLISVGLLIICGKRFNKIVGLLISFIYGLYIAAQETYFLAYNSYFRFITALSLKDEVIGVKSTIKELIRIEYFIPLIVICVINILFIFYSFMTYKKEKNNLLKYIISIGMIIGSCGLMFLMQREIRLTQYEYYNFDIIYSDYYLYEKINNCDSFVKKFGLLTFGFRDTATLIDKNSINEEDIKEIDDYFNEKDSDSYVNEMTGIFKGKNLVLIQAESLSNFAISEELTPTLYKLKTEGINVINYENPSLVGATSCSEYMVNTSIIPETLGYSVCYEYIDNVLNITLGNIFKDNGYKTYAFHNNTGDYYNRYEMFENFGYEFYDSVKMDIPVESSDNVVKDKIIDIVDKDSKYLIYWVSFSGHTPYSIDEVGCDENDINLIKETYPKLDDTYVSYLAKTMDFDKSVKYLMDNLDDAVFIIFGDHTVRDIDISKESNYSYVTNQDSDTNPWLLYTPMFIYSNDIGYKDINKYSLALDIMPTVLNMFGIEIDNKYLFGNDIFNDEYEGITFDINGNIWNDYFYYDINTNAYICDDNVFENAKELVSDFNSKRYISNKILETDYFSTFNK